MDAKSPSTGYAVFIAVAVFVVLVLLAGLAPAAQGTLDGDVETPQGAFATSLRPDYVLLTLTLNNGTGANWTNEVTEITVTFENVTDFDMTAQVAGMGVYNESGDAPGYDAADGPIAETFPADKTGGPAFYTWTFHLSGLTIPCQPGNATVYVVIDDTSSLPDGAQFKATIDKDDIVSAYGTLPPANLPPGITVTVDNTLPQALMSANVGPVVNIGATVMFTSHSTDDNGIVWRAWDFDNDTAADATGVTANYQFTAPGTFDIWHYVRDGAQHLNATHYTMTVIDNVAPVASFTMAPASPFDEDLAVAFDGTGSTDNVGVVNYSWDFENDGTPDAYGATTAHAYPQPGTFTARLVVRDQQGNTDAETHPAVVRDATAPTADISVWPALEIDEDSRVILSANGSADNIGIVSYAWDVDGDGISDMAGNWASVLYSAPGIYNITLNVTDAAGNWGADFRLLTVHDTTDPVCSFTVSPGLSFDEDAQATLSSTSTDNAGTAGLNYSWDMDGDGTGDVYAQTVLFTQPNPGQMTVTLTVTDAEGNTANHTETLTVIDVTDPVAAITTTWGAITDEDVSVLFSASTSVDNGVIANYSWSFDADTAPEAYGATASWTFSEPGIATVTLTVTDGGANTDADTFTVTVEDVTAPTGNITSLAMGVGSPVDGYYAGGLTASVLASDNVGVAIVHLYYDAPAAAARYLGNDTAAPFAVEFDSTDLADGQHMLFAVIEDAAGNTFETAPFTFTVDNTAPVITRAFVGAWYVSGALNYFTNGSLIDVTATDIGAGLSSVDVRMGATTVASNTTLDASRLTSYLLNDVEVPDAATALALRAVDRLGNVATLPLANLRFDATAPEVILELAHSGGEPAAVDLGAVPETGLEINVLDAFSANGTDAGCGVAGIIIEIAYPVPQTLTLSPGDSFRVHLGAEALTIHAVDELGNEGAHVLVPLAFDFYGGMEVKTDMMLFGWTEPSGGGHITWTLTGDLAIDLRNLIVENFDRDLPGQPGYMRIDEDEANAYLAEVEQSRATPSLENPDPDTLDKRLNYWGAKTNKYDLLYGNSDQGHELSQSVTGLVETNYDGTGPITIYFIFNADYLAGRQFPKLVEEYLVHVLFSPFGLGYEYDGPVTYEHNEIIVGLPAFYSPDVHTGTAFVLRTPIGEVIWYSAEYAGSAPDDGMETRDFDFIESPVVLFAFTLVGAYLTSYLPGRFFADLREKMPRRLRMRAKRIKLLHASAVMLIILLVALYLVPTPFTLLGSNFFFSGYIILVLAALFPTGVGIAAYFLYKKKYEELTGVTKPAGEDGAQPAPSQPQQPAYYDEAYASSNAPPPAVLQERQASPNCGICLGSIDKGMSSMQCNCGAQFHYPCIRRIGNCPVCGTVIFPKEQPAPPKEEPAPYIAPAPAPAPEPEKPAPPAMVTATCGICKNQFQHPEGAELLRVRCPSCGTILKQVDRGFNHIVLSEKPGPAIEMFVALTRSKVPGMAITSTFPTKLQRQFKLEKDTVVYWLTNTANAQNMLDPKRLDFETTRAISNFVKNNKGPVILIDGLEYLIIENGFEKILKFIKKVNDIASVNEATFIVALNPSSLPLDQATTLKKEFDKAHVVDKYDEPKFD